MCYDFLMLTDVLKIVLRQHVYRGFYDKMPSFFAVFLRIWSICCMLSRQINLNNMEKEEPIKRRVYRKSLNYGATVVSVVSYAFVTVVPPRMSRSFHGHGKTVTSSVEQVCQHLLSQLFQRIVCSLTCSLTILVDYLSSYS